MALGLNHAGCFDGSAQQDVKDLYAPAAPFTVLTATQTLTSKGGNYIARGGSAITITIPAPTAGADDGQTIMLTAGDDYASKFTCTGKIQRPTSATECDNAALPAYTGASICLRAYNGYWQELFSAGTITYS